MLRGIWPGAGRSVGQQPGHPRLDVLRPARERGRQVLVAVGSDQHVVLDPDADPAVLRRDRQVVGLEVQAGLDGEHHPRLQHRVQVHLPTRLRAVVHVKTEVVAGAVDHPAPVVLPVGAERLLGGAGQQTPLLEPGRDHLHRGGVHGLEARTRAGDGEGGVRGVEHPLVDPALRRRELPGDRQGPRDVGRVQGLDLHARVDQHQVALAYDAVVADPVQRAGVVAGGRDRLVSDGVALLAGMTVERRLDHPLAAAVGHRPAQVAHDPLETGDRRGNGCAHLLDLELVLDQGLVKDEFEVEQMRAAIAATVAGFERIVRNLRRAVSHRRGERVIEATFDGHAREEGNTVGYETIAAAGDHASTLHWIRNDGVVREGDLVLVDAGVEVETLYTADVTRTLPVSGQFTPAQRRVYQGVLDAADAAFAVARPGSRFQDVHDAAMEVIAARLEEWGLLPCTAEESLSPVGQYHRRWMVHGTSHHLGLDVHDCAQARREMYLDAILEPGMVFTIEPGLYFKADDLAVPAEYRGIGVRIEDDVLITADGNENLSAALPRRPEDVEAWMAGLLAD